jgi:hypothetical protein
MLKLEVTVSNKITYRYRFRNTSSPKGGNKKEGGRLLVTGLNGALWTQVATKPDFRAMRSSPDDQALWRRFLRSAPARLIQHFFK